MRVRFLGTGTSFGVPVIGCDCAVCRSEDPRDKRTRHSMLLSEGRSRLLVDTPPESRLQLIAADVDYLDAVFISHEHADHTHGLDDLRIFTLRAGRPLPFSMASEFAPEIRRRFAYIWGAAKEQPGSALPDLDLTTFEDRDHVSLGGFDLTPIAFPHGVYRSYGFRTGGLGVIIDGKSVPDDAVDLLRDLEVLVINALWFGNPHPGHFSIEEAIETSRRLGARRTYLTHLTHRVSQAELDERLPEGIEAAYDGLEIEVR
jgi:phosphoribosyl 1,2-cyclic phosphate phosphodiesterase